MSFRLAVFLFLIGIGVLVLAATRRPEAGLGGSSLAGLGAGIAMLVGAWVMGERGKFRFDSSARQFTWQRQRVGWTRGGSVPWTSILRVRCQSLEDEGSKLYRLVVDTEDGTVPLTWSHSPHRDSLWAAADRIREFMQRDERSCGGGTSQQP